MKKIIIYSLIMILTLTTLCFGEVVDFVVSDGMGPYKLSNTSPKDVEVSVAKKVMDPLNYNINEEKATIFFVQPPKTGQVIKVSYNTTPVSVKSDATNLVINSYQNDNNEFSRVSSSWNGKLLGGDLGLKLGLNNNQGSTDTENLSSSVDYKKTFGKLTLGATYTTTGDNLKNVDGYKAENDLLQLLMSYNENNISLDTKYVKYENTGKTVTTNNLGYNLNPNLKFNIAYNTENIDTDATQSEKNVLNYSLENKFKNMTAKLYSENTDSTSLSAEKYGVVLGSTNYSANASTEHSETSGVVTKTDTIGGKINAGGLTLDATNIDKNIGGTRYTNQYANMGITGKNASLQTTTEINYTDGERVGVINTAKGSMQVGKHTKVTEEWTGNRSGSDITNSYATGLAYTTDKFNLSSSYKTSRKNDDDLTYEILTSMAYNPNARLAWTISYLNRELAKNDKFNHLKLTGNYNIDKINVYALYIDRNSKTVDYEDTKSAKLTYQIFKFLELSSQWTDNPVKDDLYEDKTEYNYGMKLNFGDFGLSGNVYETLNELDFKTNQKYDFGLTAKLFGGNLTGTVVFNNVLGINSDYYRQYILGFSKNIGKTFTLSMSGEYDERNLNHQGFNREDIKGNLDMGINF